MRRRFIASESRRRRCTRPLRIAYQSHYEVDSKYSSIMSSDGFWTPTVRWMSWFRPPPAARFLPTRRYASAVFAVIACLSVCLSLYPSVTKRYCIKMAKHKISRTTPHVITGTLVLWWYRSLRIRMGSSPTEAPNAGGVGKIAFFDWSRNLRLRRLTAENLCPSATVVRVHDGKLADEYAVSSTTLVIVEVWRSQLRSSWHQQGWLHESLLMTRTASHALCVIVEATATNYTGTGIRDALYQWKCCPIVVQITHTDPPCQPDQNF